MKYKDVTPGEFICNSNSCCPSVFETDRDSYLIIGKKLDGAADPALLRRVGATEYIIEVPKGMIDGVR